MKDMNVDLFLDFKFISNLSANPSEDKFAYLVAVPNIKKNEYNYQLYLYDQIKNQKIYDLKNKGSFLWETDQSILFPYTKTKKQEKKVKEEKYTIYYRYDLLDKKLELAYEFPFVTSIIKVLKNNQLLLSSTLDKESHNLYKFTGEDRKKLLEQKKKSILYEDIDEIPFYFNGLGFIANQRNQLFIYDINKKSIDPIMSDDFNTSITLIKDDLETIYFTGQYQSGVRRLTSHIYQYNLKTKKVEKIYDKNDYSIGNLYEINNKIIVAASDMKEYGINQNKDFYMLINNDLELFATYRESIGNSIGSDVRLQGTKQDFVKNNILYFVSTTDDHSEIHTLDLKKEINKIFKFDGSLDGIIRLKDDVYFVGLHKQKLQEIYHLNLSDYKFKQITKFNQKVLSDYYIAKPKEIVLKNKTHDVKGFVLYPKDFDINKKYSAILDIHGGPKTVYGKVYYHEMQYFSNQGYFVIYANPRGSDGKGDQFSDIRGKYGTIDYDDLMNYLDLVLSKISNIDCNNLFVTGGSYGGFMTNWIVGATNKFRAAVTQRSISNWLSFYGTSDIGYFFAKDQNNGHPNIDTDLLWKQSPLKYALSIKTPLLFIHSDMDYRCPIEQAMQLFTILKENNVETKLIWFKGENHDLSRNGKPQARVKRLNEITNWFNTHKD
jgi:dipeptidyl aminopeptidase/acylaminoacyl peptidase